MDKLVIESGKKVFSVFVDVHVINDHGNLLDAAALAAFAALKNTKIPKIENEQIVREEFERDLPVVHHPINVSVCRVGDKIIFDPILEEESIIDSKLSIAVREDGMIVAMQKQGEMGINFEDLKKMIDLAIEKSKEIREMI
jgi:exosome complex component RRP42